MTIVGLDAAVQNKDIGCVKGNYENGSLTITDSWNRNGSLEEFIVNGLRSSEKALIAIDAPLGWPLEFRKLLSVHQAGNLIKTEPDLFFKRKTDLDIRHRFKKTPLEISADRIARTAFFTLNRIGSIAGIYGESLPLLWDIEDLDRAGILEVYPAATLIANDLSIKGYKKGNKSTRQDLLEQLQKIYNFKTVEKPDLTTVEHDFDAFVCCLAALDFIQGKSLPPIEISEAIKEEGWIWVKKAKII